MTLAAGAAALAGHPLRGSLEQLHGEGRASGDDPTDDLDLVEGMD